MKLPNIFAKKCKKVEKTAFYLYKSKNSSNFAGYLYAHLHTHMKRFLYIVGVILVSMILVSGMIVGALMSDEVETAAVQLATKELSKILGTEAHVGAVEYKFPAKIAIKDVYLADQQGDTLGYIGELNGQFEPLALREGEIRFSHVRLRDVVANIYQVEGEGAKEWNYQFLLDAFKSEKKNSDPLKSLIAVRDVQLDNIRVRYEEYEALLSHAQMDLHGLSAELLDAEISNLGLRVTGYGLPVTGDELEVEDLKAHVIWTDSLIQVPTMMARLPQSKLELSRIEIAVREKDFRLKAPFNINAQLVPADIRLVVPRFSGFKRSIALSGEIAGESDSLSVRAMEVLYNGQTILDGDITAIGLTKTENPYLRANLTDLRASAAQIQDFLSQFYGRPVKLPAEVHRLGTIHYRGLAEGELREMTLHGAFRTALGAITTDGTLRSDSAFEHMVYDARVEGKSFRLGRMLANSKLGTVTLEIASKGKIDDGQVSGDVKAHVRKFTYNGYTYADLHLDGTYAPKRYKGSARINDPHLDASFDGVVDLHDVNPEINFNLLCKHFDSAPLGIGPLGDRIRTKFDMAVDLSGAKPDEISGYLVIDSLFLATSRDSILMEQMMLIAEAEGERDKTISLQNDYLQAKLDGSFRYGDIVPATQAMIHHYLPTAVDAPKKRWQPVAFRLEADGDRLRDIQRLFKASLTLSDHPSLQAETRIAPDEEPKVALRFFAPGVRAGNTPVHDLTITLNTIDTLRHTQEAGSGLALSVSAEAMQMHTVLSTLAFRDTLLTQITLRQKAQMNELLPEGWERLTPRELQRALSDDLSSSDRQKALLAAQRAGNYGGDLKFITYFSRYNRKPLIDVHFMPGTLVLRDSVYTLGESHVTYCAADTSVQIDQFSFEGGGQHLRANGLASRHAKDTLHVDLQKIDASYVVPFLLPVQTIMFNGLLTGEAKISGALKQAKVDTQIHIDSMGLNNCWFGDAEVDLHITDSLAFHADVYRPDRKVVDLNGKALFNGSGKWELDMMADSVPLAFVNHWTSSVLTDLDGNGTGRVVVGGRKGLTYVLLRCAAQNASLTLPWTGARYTIAEDTIVMDTTAILFPNVHLTDPEGNPVEVNGGVYHDQFRDFTLDIHVDAHNALVFDSNKKGEMLQGSVYASGHVDVTGSEDDILVFADARTSKNSKFRLSIDNVSSAYESAFVHFVEHPELAQADTTQESDLDNIDIAAPIEIDSTIFKRAGRCLLKLNLEVNPMLNFLLVLGERNGDIIQARGTGALQLAYDTETGDVSLLGSYDIEKGTMSYTIANVIRKEFTVGEGSTISFSGDATNPQLNVTAKYRVTANLRDLFGGEAEQLGTSRSNVPVMTCLHMTGTLNNPILSFSLEFPLSDQAIQQQVRQVINTDEMLMRQVIYLLVFGRFFTPDYMSNTQYATLNSTYSLLSSTVTSQINAWLSKLTDMLTLGVAIRQDGEGATASSEYEAQFQLQPVDRLVINGNVGYRYNDISNQPFFGDLDVEVMLTEDGQWRLKGYTHTVDKYTLRQASTIQGFGFMWKKDF